MFVPRIGRQAEPTFLSETDTSTSLQSISSDIGFQEPELKRVLEQEETVKGERRQARLQGCAKTGGESRGHAYLCSAEEHIPRYMPSGLHELGEQLESHILFHEKDGSLPSHNNNYAFSNSHGSTRCSPLPPSPGMPSPGSCWPVAEHSSEAPKDAELATAPLHTRNITHIDLPLSPSENGRLIPGTEMLHSATIRLLSTRMTSQDAAALTKVTDGQERLDVKEGEEVGEGRILDEAKSEFLHSPRFTSSQPDSAVDIESPQGCLMSDTESDSEGEWLTGRYIPDFLREQWLSGSALELPTMEACALAIVRQALVEQVMTAFPVFDPRWAADFTTNAGYGDNPSTSTTSKSNRHSGSNSSSSNHGRKRSWDDEDDPSADGNDGPPEPMRLNPRGHQDLQFSLKLACPFRKHDAGKYNISEYRVCATKPWDSINRLKEHLTRVHKAPIYCPKCKHIFGTSEALESHLDVPDMEQSKACKYRDVPKPAGMTPAMEEKLKGRWRTSAPQALWGKIYAILFPNDAVPAPYFEPTPNIATPPGPGPSTLKFERPSLRELHRAVRARVENHIDNDIKSLPEHAKTELTKLIEECYIQLGPNYPPSQEARQSTPPSTRVVQRLLENEALLGESLQQRNWDTVEDSRLQLETESKGEGAEIDGLPPQRLAYPGTPPLQLPSTNTNLPNCFCMGQCDCFAPTSSASVMPDMDFGNSDMYVSPYAALWNCGPTDMGLFDSYVNEDSRPFLGSGH